MLTRRSLLARAVAAVSGATLAAVSRWMPCPSDEPEYEGDTLEIGWMDEADPCPDFEIVRVEYRDAYDRICYQDVKMPTGWLETNEDYLRSWA